MDNLSPRPVWAHFAAICAIPHPSRHEAALRRHLIDWAQARGIEAVVDVVGNLILRKPASPGHEDRPGVILQGHLDMVAQANAGTPHDFERDPIHSVVRDGWLVADDTTLGADNGIGVALALTALEDPGLTHPPLEVLLTVNEEDGMDGVRGLAPGTLRGRVLINLDTEEWGHFYLGCAGAVDVEFDGRMAREPLPSGHLLWHMEVAGLRGGHSGIDIHLGRGNAIKLLVEALRELANLAELRIVSLQGGSARNAIPREATALIALPAGQASALAGWRAHCLAGWQARLAQVDPGVRLTLAPSDEDEIAALALSQTERDRLLAFLDRAPYGVTSMSPDFPDVVETSNNLGMACLEEGRFHGDFLVRSLSGAGLDQLAGRLREHAAVHGLPPRLSGAYPGWTPNPESPLLALCQQAFARRFGREAAPRIIHCGLECGLLAASHPGLDMISFGPDIRGAHAPGERVEIASVGHCWELLKALLETLATSPGLAHDPGHRL